MINAYETEKMHELEFRKRLYANPGDLEQDLLDAARANPAYQKILDETLAFEAATASLLAIPEAPEGMLAELLAIPEKDAQETSATEAKSTITPINMKKQTFFQYYAIAASLLLAVGIVISLSVSNTSTASNIAFGDEMLAHLHHDIAEIDDIGNGQIFAALDFDEVNASMANTGTRLAGQNSLAGYQVRSAKPCEILAAYQSAHLVLAGARGAVSIIVINNSPVDVQFSIRDERFNGIVMPTPHGNMILVGEKNEDLDQYLSYFSENIEWLI
jgi:hypothetical protein